MVIKSSLLFTLCALCSLGPGQIIAADNPKVSSLYPMMKITPEMYTKHITHRAGTRKIAPTPIESGSATNFVASRVDTVSTMITADTMGINLIGDMNLSACNGVYNWNQGNSGNCWVFASTAACSINMGYFTSMPQLFSPQWFDSDYFATTGASTTNGGDIFTFCEWYSTHPFFVPWTNTGASYVDAGNVNPSIPASSISTNPSVPFPSIENCEILTYNVGQAQAIADIKHNLDLHQAVVLTMLFPSQNDLINSFQTWWCTADEYTPWPAVDSFNGSEYGSEFNASWDGHMVCIVGYDNTNNSWLCLNSWGAPPNRPDGYFEFPQAMNYNDTLFPANNPFLNALPIQQYEFDAIQINWPWQTQWPGCQLTCQETTSTGVGGNTNYSYKNYVWTDQAGLAHAFLGTSSQRWGQIMHVDQPPTYNESTMVLNATSVDGQWTLIGAFGNGATVVKN